MDDLEGKRKFFQGEMVQMGTYNELINSSSSFAHLLEDIHQHEQEMIINIEKQQSIISSIYSEKDNEEELINNIDTKQEGTIKWNIYTSYIKAGFGYGFGFIFILLILIAHQGLAMYSSWWLATWSDDESYRYQNFSNCTSGISETINNVSLMTNQQWNTYRNQRFYIYCGELNSK